MDKTESQEIDKEIYEAYCQSVLALLKRKKYLSRNRHLDPCKIWWMI